MPNAESTDRTPQAVEKNNSPQFNVPYLIESIPNLTISGGALPQGFPPADSLLTDFARAIDHKSALPKDFKVGNVPGPGSGAGGDNGFGPAPEWARAIDHKSVLPKDFKVGDVPGPGSKAPSGKLDTIPNRDPFTEVAQAIGDKQSGKLIDNNPEEQRRQENARQAADVLNGRGDLGNEYQRNQIKEMYRKALEEGGQGAADKLTQAINKELERRGSNVRVSSAMDFSTGGQIGDGIRLRVMKGSQQVDEARVSKPSQWERRGVHDSF